MVWIFFTQLRGFLTFEEIYPMEGFDPKILVEICNVKIPFGKYKDTVLADLPVSYLEWFMRNGGFPKGKLGMQLSTIYEIKINGLMDLLTPIRGNGIAERTKTKTHKF